METLMHLAVAAVGLSVCPDATDIELDQLYIALKPYEAHWPSEALTLVRLQMWTIRGGRNNPEGSDRT